MWLNKFGELWNLFSFYRRTGPSDVYKNAADYKEKTHFPFVFRLHTCTKKKHITEIKKDTVH